MKGLLRARECDIKGVYVVHSLEGALPLVVSRESGVRRLRRQADGENGGGRLGKGVRRSVGPAPVPAFFVESDFLGIREYDMGELQPFGLVYGHDPDGVAGRGGTQARVVAFLIPILEKALQAVATLGAPVLEIVQE